MSATPVPHPSATTPAAELPAPLLARLRDVVGAENLKTDADTRALYSQDVYRAGKLASAVVSPTDRSQVGEILRAASEASVSVYVRGGGMSYTDAFTPEETPALLIDLSGLDRVLEINAQDLYARVEAGCTWAALDAALAPEGLRAVFWGPMSGSMSTVGGAMSQGAVTFGSGRNGPSAAAALGFDVVLADGSVLQTGADAQVNRVPFLRYYGPDLTGLFSCDGGALGVKTTVTLQLERRPALRDGLSFAFEDFSSLVAGVREVAQQGLATEVFGAETALARMVADDSNFRQDLKTLLQVGRAAGNPITAIRRMLAIAAGGRRFLTDSEFTVSFLAEAPDSARLAATLRDIRRAVGDNGYEIPNTMAQVVGANPFPAPGVLGPGGRRLLPLHGVMPYSRATGLHDAFKALLAREADNMQAQGVDAYVVYATTGASGFLWECVFYWPDEWLELHKQAMDAEILGYMQESEARPEARALVEKLRLATIDLMHEHGAAHYQLGRAYPFSRDRSPEALGLLRDLKSRLDPQNLINPGALGL